MKIGIFGGTFNPVHIGHVRAAEAFVSELGLDRLFVLPNFLPPLKGKESAPAFDRLEMLKIAFFDFEKAIINDFELQKGDTSYTYKTLEYFKSIYPEDEIFLLIGDDNLLIFQKWVNTEYILKNCNLCVALRLGADITEVKSELEQKYNAKIIILSYNPTIISSTELRVCELRDKELCEYLPSGVYNYISEKGLYK
ncbi:MAG: nicotinate (nicotinamide) nucleotide adenylyltransferase [Clostridiales bacterium GWF2_36_10]|nr:MAG: nicotinate (nicotinamide) nucleotide adenylyltransferase [Clostridiales bacterium GWF2_36_10]